MRGTFWDPNQLSLSGLGIRGATSHMNTLKEFDCALKHIESKLNDLVIEAHNAARAIEGLDKQASAKANSLRKMADSLSDMVKVIKNESD